MLNFERKSCLPFRGPCCQKRAVWPQLWYFEAILQKEATKNWIHGLVKITPSPPRTCKTSTQMEESASREEFLHEYVWDALHVQFIRSTVLDHVSNKKRDINC
jgi:hypothetical protein